MRTNRVTLWPAPIALLLCFLLGAPAPAQALELSAGAGAGGILTGTVPHIAVSPHVRLSWRKANGLMFAAQGMMSILIPNNGDGVGASGLATAVIGYAVETRDFSVGPSLSIYDVPACGSRLCGRVVGVAPGGHAQVNAYFFGPLGVSVNADVGWTGGEEPRVARRRGDDGRCRPRAAMVDPGVRAMKRLLWIGGLAISCAVACNYTVGECYPVGQGAGSTGVGASVVSSGGTGASGDGPPSQPRDVMSQSECNAQDSPTPASPGDGAHEAGLKVFCTKPNWGAPCSDMCFAKGIGCVYAAVHPYKPAVGVGKLFSCNDLAVGFMCGYHYDNGDDCYFPFGTPFPRVCSYSGNN